MRFRDRMVRNIASPYGLTAASLLFFLVAWTFPPATYSLYVQEPDLMFLDPASLLYFLLCALAFVLGLMLIDFFFSVSGLSRGKIEVRVSPMWFILLPVIAGTALTVLSIIVLLRNNVNLIEVLMAVEGSQLKSEASIETGGSIGLASLGLMGIVWWAIWRKHQLNIRGWRQLAVQFAIVFATGTVLVSAALKLARLEFMPIVAGIAILFLLGRVLEGRLTIRSASWYAAVFVTFVVVLFASFSMLRGVSDLYWLIGDLLGYTISSYNRLAAILDGRMHYPFAGRGIYISAFVALNHTFNQILPVNRLLAWPDVFTLWHSEFDGVAAAGLNRDMIWSGTFGYIFSDLGWLSPCLLFAYGLMTGWVWRSLKLGRVAGVVLYPWFAFCIMLWFAMNFLLDATLFVLLIDVIVLGLYELLLVRTPKEVAQA